MTSPALLQLSPIEAAWAAYQAARELRCAVDALDDARSMLRSLVTDTGWQSDGIRAMLDALADLDRRVGAEAAEVRARAAEVAGIELP